MTREKDEFRVRPGRSPKERVPGGRFTAQVQRAALRQGPGPSGRGGRYNRTGLGRAAARGIAVASPRRPGLRRVVVKARVVKLASAGGGPAAHLKYLQRDGVTPDSGRGQLYGPMQDEADGRAFLARSDGDPHQFRFIVAAEDGADLADLRAFTRDLMRQAEQDLGVPLDWVAVDHFNAGHPHSHIVLRGRDRDGRDLLIAGDYIAHGFRARASELATLELGPETQRDIQRRLAGEVEADRFTPLDRAMLRQAVDGVVPAEETLGAVDRALRLGRLAKLERMGLATPRGGGTWRLAPDLEATLRQLGERGDIIKSMAAAAASAERGRALAPEAVQLHDRVPQTPIVGRLIGRRLTDELGDQLAVVVDGVDGRLHHLAVGGDVGEITAIPVGAVVAVGPPSPRPADAAVADLAGRHGGLYRPSQHLAERTAAGGDDPEGFVQAHVRRLEALRRAGLVERLDADTWRIASDHQGRAAAYDARRARQAQIQVLSTLDLEAQVAADGATWLDRKLVAREPAPGGQTGFGAELNRALQARLQRHLGHGDAERTDGEITLRPGLLAELRRREVARVGAALAQQTGLAFGQAASGEAIDGVYRRRLQLASGAFALVERSHDFVLVPWRPVIEPSLGHTVSGVAQSGGGIDWRLGRTRGPAL